MTATNGAVVVGGYVNALGVARELAAAGIPVAAVHWEPFAIVQYSRVAATSHRLADPADLVGILESLAAAYPGWLLIPTNDHALTELAKNRDRLRARYRVGVPHWETTRRLVDKAAANATAAAAGLALPRTYGAATVAAVRELEFDFPVLVKPDRSHLFQDRFGAKLFVATDRDELVAAVRATTQAGLVAQLMDYVPGPDRATLVANCFVGPDGEPSEVFCFRRLRQTPPRFGVSSAAEPCSRAGLVEPTRALLAQLRWRGPAAVEFKLDARDGSYRFLEINGRSVLPNRLLRQAGFPMALAQWREAAGEAWRPEPSGWPGRWFHLHADLATQLLGSRRSTPTWAEFRRSYTGPKVFAVWSARDPGPFLAQWSRSLLGLLRLPFRAAERRALRRRVEVPPRT